MKQLIIVRHAQAHSIDEGFYHDRYRTLTTKGVKQAQQIWLDLQKKGIKPDIIVTSHAPRAYQTALWIANELCFDYHNIHTYSESYQWNTDIRSTIIGYYKEYNSLLICGHNPELLLLCQQYDHTITELKKWEYKILSIKE